MKRLLSITVLLLALVALIGCKDKVKAPRTEEISNLELVEMENGWMINSVLNNTVSSISIPEEHDGKPITSIQREAFKNCTKIKTLTIPYNVTYVGSYAFKGCTSLNELYISNESAVIEETAFESCPIFKAQVPGTHIGVVPKENLTSLYLAGGTVAERAFADFPLLSVIGVSGDVVFNEHALDGCAVISFRVLASEIDKLAIKESVSYLTIAPDRETNTTTLYRDAFKDYTNLRGITLENNNTTFDIREGAFDNCTATTFSVPASLMKSLPTTTKKLTITSGEIEYLGSTRAMALEVLIIKDGVTSVASGAFRECPSLRSVAIVASIDKIDDYTFYKCPSLESLDIGGTSTEIGKSAFADCTSLSELLIGTNIATVCQDAFKGCTSLTKLQLGSRVTAIEKNAFENCTSLEELSIGKSLTSLDFTAFLGCGSIKTISVSSSNTAYALVDKSLYTKDKKTLIKFANSDIAEYVIPEGTEVILEEAFLNATSLSKVVMPETITSIGKRAFDGCTSLSTINISGNITAIENNTFANCTSLRYIVIPKNVEVIGEKAFYKCSNLKSITIGEGVCQIKTQAFYGCDSLESILIPKNVEIVGERILASCESLALINCEAKEIPSTWDESWSKGNDAEIALGFETQSGEI